MNIHWIFLALAIFSEVIATSSLKESNGFTQFWPSVVVVLGYTSSFYFLSLTLKAIPLGIAYAVWSGIGVVLISLIGRWYYSQHLDWPAIFGIIMILAGVVVINLFSSSTTQ